MSDFNHFSGAKHEQMHFFNHTRTNHNPPFQCSSWFHYWFALISCKQQVYSHECGCRSCTIKGADWSDGVRLVLFPPLTPSLPDSRLLCFCHLPRANGPHESLCWRHCPSRGSRLRARSLPLGHIQTSPAPSKHSLQSDLFLGTEQEGEGEGGGSSGSRVT